jgi:hypothetical protein
MDVFDKFFRKFAYKFDKGYPDMKNEKDILLLESLFVNILNEEIILEKALSWSDLSDATRKYYRLSIIDDKIKKGEPFKLENGSEEVLTYVDDSYSDLFANQKVKDIKDVVGTRTNQFPLFKDSKGNELGFSSITKTKELGGTGGSKSETTERQERSLVDAINSVKGPKTVVSQDGSKIENIVSAEKYEGSSSAGTEPYSDVILNLEDGTKLLVSAKGPSAPTLGSGGITGIKVITKDGANPEILDFVKDFYERSYQYYKDIVEKEGLKDVNLYKNKLVPDVSVKVPENILKTLLVGTPEMGGPVSYYYIGPMDVKYNTEGNTIKLNGNFISVDDFIEKKGDKLYAHIRKRDGDMYFTDAKQSINGVEIPAIFVKTPGGTGIQSRFGMIDKIRGVEI